MLTHPVDLDPVGAPRHLRISQPARLVRVAEGQLQLRPPQEPPARNVLSVNGTSHSVQFEKRQYLLRNGLQDARSSVFTIRSATSDQGWVLAFVI